MENVLNSKEFWKTRRSFLFDKNADFSQNSVEQDSRIISDNFDLSEEFSTFFEDVVRRLNVKPDGYCLSDMENLNDAVEIFIRKFENHPSVQAIKKNISVNQEFCFSKTNVRDILKKTTA